MAAPASWIARSIREPQRRSSAAGHRSTGRGNGPRPEHGAEHAADAAQDPRRCDCRRRCRIALAATSMCDEAGLCRALGRGGAPDRVRMIGAWHRPIPAAAAQPPDELAARRRAETPAHVAASTRSPQKAGTERAASISNSTQSSSASASIRRDWSGVSPNPQAPCGPSSIWQRRLPTMQPSKTSAQYGAMPKSVGGRFSRCAAPRPRCNAAEPAVDGCRSCRASMQRGSTHSCTAARSPCCSAPTCRCAPGPTRTSAPRISSASARFCMYKAFAMNLNSNQAADWADLFDDWMSAARCEGPRDPRVLPFHIFRPQRTSGEPVALDQPEERQLFRSRHYRNAAWVDADDRRWAPAEAHARHGREPQIVGNTPLPLGFHWDVKKDNATKIFTPDAVW